MKILLLIFFIFALNSCSFLTEEPVFLFAGDSIVEAWNLKEAFQGSQCINIGVSGDQIYETIALLTANTEKTAANFVLVGTNDTRHYIRTTLSDSVIMDALITDYRKLFETLQNKKTPFYIYSVNPVNDGWSMAYADSANQLHKVVNSWIASELTHYSLGTYIDSWSQLSGEYGNLSNEYTYDGLHFNRLGYERVENETYQYLH